MTINNLILVVSCKLMGADRWALEPFCPTFVFTQDNTTKAAILYNMLTYQNGFLVVREDPKLLDDAGEIPKS